MAAMSPSPAAPLPLLAQFHGAPRCTCLSIAISRSKPCHFAACLNSFSGAAPPDERSGSHGFRTATSSSLVLHKVVVAMAGSEEPKTSTGWRRQVALAGGMNVKRKEFHGAMGMDEGDGSRADLAMAMPSCGSPSEGPKHASLRSLSAFESSVAAEAEDISEGWRTTERRGKMEASGMKWQESSRDSWRMSEEGSDLRDAGSENSLEEENLGQTNASRETKAARVTGVDGGWGIDVSDSDREEELRSFSGSEGVDESAGEDSNGVSKQRKARFIPPQVYLNDRKLPVRRWTALEGPASRRIRDGSQQSRATEGQEASNEVAEILPQVMKLKHYEDVDRVLNHWNGRTSRQNFPVLMKEITKSGNLQLSLKVFNWVKSQRCYRARTDMYNMLCQLAARHRRLNQTRRLFYEMQEWRCTPNLETYSALISAHGRARDPNGAAKVFETMLQNGIPPSRCSYNLLIHAYGVSGQWEQALEMYDRMLKAGVPPDIITYNTILTAFRNGEQYQKALDFYKKMLAMGVTPKLATLNIVMNCHAKLRNHDDVLEIFDRMKEEKPGTGLKPDIITYNLLMHSYAAGGRFAQAREVFDCIVRDGLEPNVVSYNTLIDAYATWGKFEEAQNRFDMLIKAGIEPDVVSYSSLINAYGKGGNPDGARQVLDLMKRKLCKPNVVTYNVLIDAYSRAGRFEEAIELKEEIERVGLQATVVTYCSLIAASGRTGRPELASGYVQEAEEKGIRLNVAAYNALIWAYLAGGQHEQAMSAFRVMKEKGLIPDEVTYSVLLDQAAKEGNLEVGKQLFEQMGRAGLKVTVEAGTAMVDAYGSQGMLEDARRVLEQMKDMGVKPNVVTYTALTQAYGKAGLTMKAQAAFEEMEAEGIEPDQVAYASLLHVYNLSSQYEEVLRLAKTMEVKGVISTEVAYNEILVACAKLRDWKEAEKVWREIRKQTPCPASVRTFNLLLDTYGKSGKYERALQVFLEMENLGLEPTVLTYNVLMRALARAWRWQKCLQVLQWMRKAGVKGTLATFNCALSSLSQAGLWEQALEVKQHMDEDGVQPDLLTYRSLLSVLVKGGQEEKAREIQSKLLAFSRQNDESLVRMMQLLEGAQGVSHEQTQWAAEGRGEEEGSMMATEGEEMDAHDVTSLGSVDFQSKYRQNETDSGQQLLLRRDGGREILDELNSDSFRGSAGIAGKLLRSPEIREREWIEGGEANGASKINGSVNEGLKI